MIVVLALALTATIAFAALGLMETSTKTRGATTITWDSSFADFDYTCGSVITMTVNWTVDAGAAEFAGFALKENKKGKGGFTPRSKKDPATGEVSGVTYPGANGANSVDVSFRFTGLHLDKRRSVDVGNAHFKLYLNIDTDGDETPDSVVGYGVNVHVEDPEPYGCP